MDIHLARPLCTWTASLSQGKHAHATVATSYDDFHDRVRQPPIGSLLSHLPASSCHKAPKAMSSQPVTDTHSVERPGSTDLVADPP